MPTRNKTLDAIRIVPLHPPEARLSIAAAPVARLTYRNGPLISTAGVFTVFWGRAWKTAPQSGMVDQLHRFFDFILTSALIDQLTEYNIGQYRISHGSRTGSATITATSPRGSVTDTAIQTFLKQLITNGGVPKATAKTLYFIYPSPGVRVVMGGGASCQAFCGYHNAIGTKMFYAVMPYRGCTGCTGNLTTFDALTSTSSHELCEAITDPIPGQGWYDDSNGEIGDICSWQTKQVGQYTVQLEWSNKANACV